MPKSGWRIINPDKIKKEWNNIFKYVFLPSMPLLRNQALNIKKNGLINSEGWILIPPILNHRFDPLISYSSNKIVTSIMVKIINPTKDNLLKDLTSIEETVIINTIADIECKMCLLNNDESLLIENDKITPIVAIAKIIKKFTLSISFHHFDINLNI